MPNNLNPDEFRVPASRILDKYDQYYVQPALFDEYAGEEKYSISEAARGLTALGVPTGWRSMGRQYVNGKLLAVEDANGGI